MDLTGKLMEPASLTRAVPLSLILLITVACIALFKFMQWRVSRSHMYKLAAKIAYPNTISMLPVIGHAHNFVGNSEHILNAVLKTCEAPSPSCVWLGHRLFFMINRPEDLKIIMNSPKCLPKDDLYRFAKPMIGDGLAVSAIPKWKKHRKLLLPTFNQKLLDQYVEVFAKESNLLATLLEKEVGKTFDVSEYFGNYTIDSFCESSISLKVSAQTENPELARVIDREMEIGIRRMFNVFYHSQFIYNFTQICKEEQKLVTYFHNYIKKVVADRRKMYQNIVQEDVDTSSRKPFLDLLLEMSDNGRITNDEIIDEVKTFLIAGTDTVATVLCFTAVMLGLHPDIEQKVYEEVIEVVGLERSVEYQDLPKLVYLEKVIKETMRLFPVGPLIVRKVEDDLQLETCTVPKGSGVVLVIISTHRNAKYHKDPMKFDPERFNAEAIAKMHPFAYLPFSGGPRNCIGAKHGMMTMLTVMATLVRKYRFETEYKSVEQVKVKQAFIIKAVHGFPIRIIPRN